MAPVTRRKRQSELAEESAANTPDATPSKNNEKLPLRGKDAKDPDEGADEEASSATLVKAPENKKTVFNDDDDTPAPIITKEPAQVPGESEEEEDEDSDEGPEAVSTLKAASELKKSAQASQKVAQE
jgi:hypothetical protein